MGTEMSLPEVEGIDLKDFLPRYMLDEELFSEEMPFEGPSDTYFLPAALLSPGVLHITDNMTKEVDASLPFWRDWLGGLQSRDTFDLCRARAATICCVVHQRHPL